MLALALASSLSVAQAAPKDQPSARVKVDSTILSLGSFTETYEEDDAESVVTIKDMGLGISTGPVRYYAGFALDAGFELGAALELSRHSQSYESRISFGGEEEEDDDDLGTNSSVGLLLSATFERELQGDQALYIQPKLGVHQATSEPEGEDEAQTRFALAGAEAGLRFYVAPRASLDLGAEGLIGRGKAYDDGDEVEDTVLGVTQIALRAGVSVRL